MTGDHYEEGGALLDAQADLRRALVLGHAEVARDVLVADLADDPAGAVVAAALAIRRAERILMQGALT